MSDFPATPIFLTLSPSKSIFIEPERDGSMLMLDKCGVDLAFCNNDALSDPPF